MSASMHLKALRYSYKTVVREPTGTARAGLLVPKALRHGPLVSCVMPTHGRLIPARFAIQCFQTQTYLDRELVLVCKDEGSEVAKYVEALADPRIRLAVATDAKTVGDLRNRAISLAAGDLICVWDDDDLYAPDRISTQLSLLQATNVAAAFLLREMLWSPRDARLGITQERLFQENTLLAWRSALPPYPSVVRGGDTSLVDQLKRSQRLGAIDDPAAYIYVWHGQNIWDPAHFEEIFSRGSVLFSGNAYEQVIRDLDLAIPLRAYAAALVEQENTKDISKS